MEPVCAFRHGQRWRWLTKPKVRLTLAATDLIHLPALLVQHQARFACGILPYPAVLNGGTPLWHHPIDVLLTDHWEEGTLLPVPIANFHITQSFQPEMTLATYQQAFARIQDYLAAGDCYQVNFAQRFLAKIEGSVYAGWWHLMQAHAAPHACFWNGPEGALLSASPEAFLHVEGRHIRTDPIKGSRPRGQTSKADDALANELLHSSKDRAENLMIVDLLRNDLGAICTPGSIHAQPLFALERFSNVQHLVSTISGTLQADITPTAALLACFPGGSITGAPKRRAMQIIDELEPVARHAYCGSFFVLDAETVLDANILIRTFQVQNDTITIHGGGGITVASNAIDEYEECHFKVRQLMQALEDSGTGR